MKNRRKMLRYNPVGIRMNQYALRDRLQAQVRRRRRRERRLLTEPPLPKIVFVVLKEEGLTYVERLEHNVEDGIDRFVWCVLIQNTWIQICVLTLALKPGFIM